MLRHSIVPECEETNAQKLQSLYKQLIRPESLLRNSRPHILTHIARQKALQRDYGKDFRWEGSIPSYVRDKKIQFNNLNPRRQFRLQGSSAKQSINPQYSGAGNGSFAVHRRSESLNSGVQQYNLVPQNQSELLTNENFYHDFLAGLEQQPLNTLLSNNKVLKWHRQGSSVQQESTNSKQLRLGARNRSILVASSQSQKQHNNRAVQDSSIQKISKTTAPNQQKIFMCVKYIGVHNDMIGVLTRKTRMQRRSSSNIRRKNELEGRKNTQTGTDGQFPFREDIVDLLQEKAAGQDGTVLKENGAVLKENGLLTPVYYERQRESHARSHSQRHGSQQSISSVPENYEFYRRSMLLRSKNDSPHASRVGSPLAVNCDSLLDVSIEDLQQKPPPIAVAEDRPQQIQMVQRSSSVVPTPTPTPTPPPAPKRLNNSTRNNSAQLNKKQKERPSSTFEIRHNDQNNSVHHSTQQASLSTPKTPSGIPKPELYNKFLVNKYSLPRRLRALRKPKMQRHEEQYQELSVDWRITKISYN